MTAAAAPARVEKIDRDLLEVLGGHVPPSIRIPAKQKKPRARRSPTAAALRRVSLHLPLEARMLDLIRAEAPKIAEAIRRAWESNAAAVTIEDLLEAVRTESVPNGLLEAWRERYWRTIETDFRRSLEAAVRAAGKDVEASASDALRQLLAEVPIVAEADRFLDARGASLLEWLLATDLRAFFDAVTQAVRVYGIVEGLHVSEIARRLADQEIVGLTSRDVARIARVREEMVAAGVSPSRVKRATSRLASRMRRRRAEMIARTELATAYNQGAFSVFDNIARRTGKTITKRYKTARDEAVCPICKPFDGTVVGLRETWEAAFPDVGAVFVPPLHIRCRCTVVYEVAE